MTQDDTSIHSSKAESDSVCRIQSYQLFGKCRKFQSILKIKPLYFCSLVSLLFVESVRKYKIINVKNVLLQTL